MCSDCIYVKKNENRNQTIAVLKKFTHKTQKIGINTKFLFQFTSILKKLPINLLGFSLTLERKTNRNLS